MFTIFRNKAKHFQTRFAILDSAKEKLKADINAHVQTARHAMVELQKEIDMNNKILDGLK